MNNNGQKNRKNISVLMISTIISALSGFVRDILVAKNLGATMQSDVYLSSNILSYTIFGIIGAAISTSFIPIFNDISENSGRSDAEAFSNKILSLIITLGIGLILLGELLAPQLTRILFYGFEGQKYELAVLLQRIMLPLTILTVLSNLMLGILQSYGEFKTTAIVGLITNFVLIMYMLFGFHLFNVIGLCAANILAYIIILTIQTFALLKKKYKFKYEFTLHDPKLKMVFSLVLPVIIGTSAGQISDLINTAVSSSFNDGEMAALTYSMRIVAACMIVFVTPFATVYYPIMSRLVANMEYQNLIIIVSRVIEICVIITIPLTVGFLVLSRPFIMFIFERGLFDEKATTLTTYAFFYYSIGLVGYSLRGFLEKVFYSLKNTKTPMLNGVIGIGINIVLVLILTKFVGYIGIAMAYSIAGIIISILMFMSLSKKLPGLNVKSEILNIIKILLSALTMGIVVYLLDRVLIQKNVILILRLMIDILVGVIAYTIVCIILKIQMALYVIDLLLTYIKKNLMKLERKQK